MDKNLHSIFTALTLLCVFFFAACEDYTDPAFYAPQISTGEVVASSLTRKEATLTGHIVTTNIKSVNSVGFRYSRYSTMEVPSEVSTSLNGETFSLTVTGLDPNTKYYYYAFASGGFNELHGQVQEFTTSQYDAPSLGQIVADQIGRTSLHVSSSFLDDGGETTVTGIGFIYYALESQDVLTTPEYLDEKGERIAYARHVDIGATFDMDIDKLVPDTEYALCAYATSKGSNMADKTGYSKVIRVRTAEDVYKPTVDRANDVSIDETEIELSSKILNDGGRSVTECGFCWSTSASNLTIQGSHIKASLNGDTFQAKIGELVAGQTYYVVAYAINDQGVGYSNTVVPVTTPIYGLPILSKSDVRVNNENSVRATAHIYSTGNSDIIDQGFCISTTNTQPDKQDRVITASLGDDNQDFSALIENLERGTQYYIRAYAINAKKGVSYSESSLFTTADFRTAPVLQDVSIEEYDETYMIICSSVINDGGSSLIERGFCWSEANTNPTQEDSHEVASGDNGYFKLTVSNLIPGKTYYVKAYAVNEKNIGYSTSGVPVSLPQYTRPSVSMPIVLERTTTGATAYASITDMGGLVITDRGFCVSLTHPEPDMNDQVFHAEADGASIKCHLLGLNPGTQYYIRAFATNRKGTAFSNTESFDTPENVVAPTVSNVDFSSKTQSTITVSATITDSGNGTIKEKGFCYMVGIDVVPTKDNAVSVTDPSSGNNIQKTLEGLLPNTTYCIRAYARNEEGSNVYSAEVTKVTTSNRGPLPDDVEFPSIDE